MKWFEWSSLAFQVACFIGSAFFQSRIKAPGREMKYFAKQTRRYYYAARGALVFQAATIVVYVHAMMRLHPEPK